MAISRPTAGHLNKICGHLTRYLRLLYRLRAEGTIRNGQLVFIQNGIFQYKIYICQFNSGMVFIQNGIFQYKIHVDSILEW